MARCSNNAIATMWMMGTFDNQFPWQGVPAEIVSQISGETMRAQWAAKNGCSPDPVETPLADLDEEGGTTAVLVEHQGCAKEFTFYRFDEMDHNWPGSSIVVAGKTNRDVHASGELARFFLRTTR